ncbi:CapA family protein [Nannocystis sp.]|uniref:CapA family protein n=1 Tax=Nannocystis sp. TaxID=1962667 RepID=UPI002426264D|nr:CapA family protein [Nannocystis sp.]MBK7827633.1 CapA family protein [Nannocystis sp.]MBK9753678.1 CapA family protein [Nannocystis sp.]
MQARPRGGVSGARGPQLRRGWLALAIAAGCSGSVDSRPPNSTAVPEATVIAAVSVSESTVIAAEPVSGPETTAIAATREQVAELPAPALPVAPPPDDRTPRLRDACVAGDTITIAAVGDLLLHEELQIQAYAAPDNFFAVWGGVRDLLAQADLSYANLEGTTAAGLDRKGQAVRDPGRVFDRRVYSSYPRFNYHPSLLDDLVASGFDVVSTANNHALDREPAGVDATIAALDRVKLAHTGTRARGTQGPWHALTRARGITVAWLACAEHTNQIPDPEGQVLRCYEPEGALEQQVRALIAEPSIDAVIVTPHWGKEYKPEPARAQRELAARLAAAGATAVIGSHPHVLQPWEVLPGAAGRDTLVIYSLGNFASHQPELPRRSSLLLYLGLTRPPGQKARVHGVRYVPLHVRQTGLQFFVEAVDRVGGPADSRALTVAMFGEAAVLAPDAPLATRPACP